MSSIWSRFQHYLSCHLSRKAVCSFAVGVVIVLILYVSLGHNTGWQQHGRNNISTAYAISDTLASQMDPVETEVQSETTTEENHTSPSESAQYAGPEAATIYGTVTVNDYVNIRTAPNTDADILGRLSDGEQVIIIGISFADHEWYQIKAGDIEGFSKAEYFTVP